jgi:4-hydroxy-tetrahydrodipicolinate reductase
VALKVAVAGGLGRMGREIALLAIASPERVDLRAVGASEDSKDAGKRLQALLHLDTPAPVLGEAAFKAALHARKFDVLVEVTGADSALGYMLAAVDARVPFVSGSTAVPDKDLDKVRRTAAKAGVAGVWTPNFSVGVNVWWSVLDKVARALPGYDVEIVEAHHNQKKDAPSGTAARAVDVLQAASGPSKVVHGRQGITGPRGREIGVHAVRMGDVVGEHTAYFSGNAERIEVTHRAHSRMAFAAGALVAVEWVAAQKKGGLYSMADVLGIGRA